MANADLSDQISRLEAEIEELAKAIERCRKIIGISRIAIVAGVLWFLALMSGALSFAPISIISAITIVIFAIVSFGSNVSTLKQKSAVLKTAEEQRAQLIGLVNPHLVRELDS